MPSAALFCTMGAIWVRRSCCNQAHYTQYQKAPTFDIALNRLITSTIAVSPQNRATRARFLPEEMCGQNVRSGPYYVATLLPLTTKRCGLTSSPEQKITTLIWLLRI